MLRDYRDWLAAELKLLGNASHHAYSFGQANMAQRAIEKLDETLADAYVVTIDSHAARRALTALALLEQRETSLDPDLAALRDALTAAAVESHPPSDEAV